MSNLLPEDNFTIPKMEDERLAEIFNTVKPLQMSDNGLQLLELEESVKKDLRGVSYTWGCKASEEAVLPELTEIAKFITYHTWGYYGFFKPSLAEVFSQIPEDIVGKAYGFTLEAGEKGSVEGGTFAALTPDQKLQWAICTVYAETKTT